MTDMSQDKNSEDLEKTVYTKMAGCWWKLDPIFNIRPEDQKIVV